MGWFTSVMTGAAPRGGAAAVLPREYGHEWAVVDVETTGLRAGQHRVVQVAAITLDAAGRQVEEFSSLVDPGCDPGPTHIHGITSAHLRGAPSFEQVCDRLGAMLDGRTLVAHNAGFDYEFLRHEFIRAGAVLPVQQRLCTLALNRRLGTPSPDMRLGTLAAHYRVPQQRAHDALDDARVLTGILRASLHAAAPLGLGLPLVTCRPKGQGGSPFLPNIAKTACSFASPGRWSPGGALVQGMKVALTGDTDTAREELVARGVQAGLNMMSNVSRHTSVLVTNDARSGSAKAERARSEGVPIIDEAQLLRLLQDVRPGQLLNQAVPSAPAQRTAPTIASPAVQPAVTGPLYGRRVLVLGSDHAATSAARAAVVGLGGAAAVNLSATVTDVLALDGAHADKRWPRLQKLGLPLRPNGWLQTPHEDLRLSAPQPAADTTSAVEQDAAALSDANDSDASTAPALVLARGQAVDLPSTGQWTFAASWSTAGGAADTGTGSRHVDVDVVAFVLDANDQVVCDDGLVFYNNPSTLDGAVTLTSDGPSEQSITVDLDALPQWAQRITIAAAIDDDVATFGDIGAVAVSAGPGGEAAVFAEATLDAATVERTLSLLELYRRAGAWRLRAVGQGWTTGLAELAVLHGVDVDE
ncbi:MAG: polymerase [Frankiales bacterium]|nr:polymerase [Frankiales bacterium]